MTVSGEFMTAARTNCHPQNPMCALVRAVRSSWAIPRRHLRAVSSARISCALADFTCTARNQPIRMSCAIPRASLRSVLTTHR
jgi:hypothetical protein